MFAAHHKLSNLIAIIDRNKLCVTGFTEKIVRLEPLDEKWRSFGWDAVNINGHSFKEILKAFYRISAGRRKKPLVIIADTTKGKGVSFMENKHLWHGLAPKQEIGRASCRERV